MNLVTLLCEPGFSAALAAVDLSVVGVVSFDHGEVLSLGVVVVVVVVISAPSASAALQLFVLFFFFGYW